MDQAVFEVDSVHPNSGGRRFLRHSGQKGRGIPVSLGVVIVIHKSYRLHGSCGRVAGMFQKSTHAIRNVVKTYDGYTKMPLALKRTEGLED